MITASEALRLQSAQLTEEEKAGRDKLLTQIKNHVINHMAFRGCEITVTETRGNVIASVTQELRLLEWQTQWQPLVQQSRLSGEPTITGLLLHLTPSDTAYTAVRGHYPQEEKELRKDLRRYGQLAGDPFRSDEEDEELKGLRQRHASQGVEPGWEPEPRRALERDVGPTSS